MRILLLDVGGNFLDFALRCVAAGHTVRWFIAPGKNGERLPIGDGLIEKVKEWQKWMGASDLILTSDNTRYMTALEPYRKLGYPIFGSNLAGSEMELNRSTGQKIWKEAGVPIMDYKTFNSYDDAIAFVEKNAGKRYVSKPSGDADKALSYVSKDSGDMREMLRRWKKKGKLAQPFILQEFKPGIEVAVGGWFGKYGFSECFNINFEHKKTLTGDLGVNCGEQGCYSQDTEVLTDDGWKFWPDVTEDDHLATLDKDHNLFFESPSDVVSFDFEGELIGWQSPNVDLLVTPNHNMYVHDATYRKPFEFVQARDCFDKDLRILRVGNPWKGEDTSSQLPSFYDGPLIAWAEFMGAYIADGNIRKDRSIEFGNVPQHKRPEWLRIITAIGYQPHEYGTSIDVHSKEMNVYLRQYGKSNEKFVPDYIKQAHPEIIEAFLRGYIIGDGSTRWNNMVCTTISKRLADDLQEIFHKVGLAANIVTRDRRGESHMIGNYLCINKQICYDIRVCQEKTKASITPENAYMEPYKGKVYCATVTSHLLLVRRNGKSAWCGNTVIYYTDKEKLAEKVLLPVTDYLHSIGYSGYIDAAVIIDKDGPWPLEWTTRPGWPHNQIITALHDCDPAEWMAELMDGYDTLEVKKGVCTGVVVTMGDFPFNNKQRDENCGIPIYCDQNEHIHPAEIMGGLSSHVVGNKLVDMPTWVSAGNYLLVATGVDRTVSGSAKKAYEVIKGIAIPNSPGYRTDIGQRLKKELPELHKLGYCKTVDF